MSGQAWATGARCIGQAALHSSIGTSFMLTWGGVRFLSLEAKSCAADLAPATASAAPAAAPAPAGSLAEPAVPLGDAHQGSRQLLVRHRQQVHQVRCMHRAAGEQHAS